MPDQAAELRRLVLQAVREKNTESTPVPRMLVVTGGKGGVGVTTLTVNTAVALAEQGTRVIAVDANFFRSDIAPLCGLVERHSIADVVSARRSIHEVLEPGPAGVQIVPGVWSPGDLTGTNEAGLRRLLGQLRTLGKHADCVLIDAGCGANDIIRRLWQAASDIVVVTTPDSASVMNSYSTIKLLAEAVRQPVHVIVNQAESAESAVDVFQRINQSCQRFLGFGVEYLGHVPEDASVKQAASAAMPFVLRSPAGLATVQVEQMASRLLMANAARVA